MFIQAGRCMACHGGEVIVMDGSPVVLWIKERIFASRVLKVLIFSSLPPFLRDILGRNKGNLPGAIIYPCREGFSRKRCFHFPGSTDMLMWSLLLIVRGGSIEW